MITKYKSEPSCGVVSQFCNNNKSPGAASASIGVIRIRASKVIEMMDNFPSLMK
jgi:hypothetical protein